MSDFSLKYNPEDVKITSHLTRGEVECNCGCKFGLDNGDFDIKTARLFETIRAIVGLPITINSGCRCPVWNKHEGGSKGSKHMQGIALDLVCPVGFDYETFYRICNSSNPNGGVGKYPNNNFVHIDTRGERQRWNG